MLRSFVFRHPTDWLKYLPLVELHYNSTVQASTGKAPSEVVFGRSLTLPADLVAPKVPTVVKELSELWKEAKTAI